MKKLFNKCTLLLIFFVGSIYNAGAQQLDSVLNVFRDSLPQEKIYIHFDKNYYNPGETIWFKAYLFTGLEPSLVSKNFYAELLDENGNVLNRSITPIVMAGAAGSFDLATNLSKNILYFRAYTIAMLNDDTSFLYLKPIRIITSAKKPGTKVSGVSIAFLPEGGDILAGTSSNIAFKVTDQNGMPVNATGYVKGKDEKKLIDFSTMHDGMGYFNLEVVAGESYVGVWKEQGGKEHTTPLPEIKSTGISLHINDVETGKMFVLQRSEDANDEAVKTIRIVGVMNQHLVYSAKANLSKSSTTSGIIPVKVLPSGILQVTIFDKNNKPLAERVTFVNNHEYEFDGDAWIPGLNTDKRGLNAIEVLINDTVNSNLSLSVTDADVNVPTQYEDNIISHLLLTGDLRGKIVNPYYYFFSTADSAKFYLDLVMLTHGWRKYNWDNVIAGKFPPNLKRDYNYIGIHGQLIGIQPGRFAAGTLLNGFMVLKDSSKQFLSIPVDKKGQLMVDGFVFYDNAKLYFQFGDAKQDFDKSMLHVDNGLWKGYPGVFISENDKTAPTFADSMLMARNIRIATLAVTILGQRIRKEQLLQEVIVKGKAKSVTQKLDEKYASGLFSGGDAHTFDVTNDPFARSSQTVFQYLQGKVAGLQITINGATTSLAWRGSSPSLYVNEMPADINLVSTMNMNDIGYIKVFRPGETGIISSSGGGAIVIYTKKGGDNTNTNSKGLDYIQIGGYSPVKQFYSPEYAIASALNDLDDVRTTLFWNPFIFANRKTRRFKFKFYNNDITHRFRLVMEGINDDGKLLHIEKVIQQQ